MHLQLMLLVGQVWFSAQSFDLNIMLQKKQTNSKTIIIISVHQNTLDKPHEAIPSFHCMVTGYPEH